MKTLRPYQDAAVNSIFNWFGCGNLGHPLVVAPVGSGKSLMIAETIKRIHASAPRTKIVMVTHVKELLVQNAEELKSHYQECDFGFYCAGLCEKKLHNDVTFASIQSVAKKAADFPRAVQVIMVDECHLISHNDTTQYRKFIDKCIEINPNCKVIGFTGTPFRSDTGRLEEGDGKIFDGICYDIGIDFMITNGYLCKPVVPKVKTVMSVEGVKTRNGDYIESQLQKAVDVDEVTKACVDEAIILGETRKKWLVFTAGVLHCEHVRDEFRSRGISCEMVTGETPHDEREKIISDYKDGLIKCLVNVAVLTTGFNCPDIDFIIYMRPMRSPVLYIQTIGRGLRVAQGKEDCLIADFANVIGTLGPIDKVNITKINSQKNEAEKKLEAITKQCPSCGVECLPQQKYCYVCSYSFIQAQLDTKASDSAVLSMDIEPEWHDVIEVTYKKHNKKGDENAPPTLCVTYYTQTKEIKEFICMQHADGSYPKNKAIDWHFDRSKMPFPDSIEDALKLVYKQPKKILVKPDGKYFRIVKYAELHTPDLFAGAEEVEL